MFNLTILLTSALFLSTISGVMTISGYANMFHSSYLLAVILFTALEFAKVVIAYRAKFDLLLMFEAVLIVFAAIGHFGFLSEAYWKDRIVYEQTNSANTIESNRYVELEKSLNNELRQIQETIDVLKNPAFKLKKIEETRERVKEIQAQLDDIRNNQVVKHTSNSNTIHNTIKYAADTAGIDEDSFARLVIYVASFTIDPLALILIFTFSKDLKHYRKERNKIVNKKPSIFNIINVKDYDVDGHQVEHLYEMSDEEIYNLYKQNIFNSQNKLDWLGSALCWREAVSKLSEPDADCDGRETLERFLAKFK